MFLTRSSTSPSATQEESLPLCDRLAYEHRLNSVVESWHRANRIFSICFLAELGNRRGLRDLLCVQCRLHCGTHRIDRARHRTLHGSNRFDCERVFLHICRGTIHRRHVHRQDRTQMAPWGHRCDGGRGRHPLCVRHFRLGALPCPRPYGCWSLFSIRRSALHGTHVVPGLQVCLHERPHPDGREPRRRDRVSGYCGRWICSSGSDFSIREHGNRGLDHSLPGQSCAPYRRTAQNTYCTRQPSNHCAMCCFALRSGWHRFSSPALSAHSWCLPISGMSLCNRRMDTIPVCRQSSTRCL